jgi:probable F420-dependent oxidoreductase
MAEMSRRVESAGFTGLWLPESQRPVFSMCSAAALSTSTLALGTSVAVAFARSPMVTAQAAWMLADATKGRFTLGLGTQVRAHVERRYSAEFNQPGPRLAEYVAALRAIYAAFRGSARLGFEGSYYSFTLLPPTWSPGPLDYPDPPIYVAGVRPWMLRMAGSTADGLLVHPLNSPEYLDAVVLPAVREGERSSGRAEGTVRLLCPVMTAVSDRVDVLHSERDAMRDRIAFYGSTPGYGPIFESSGWPDVAPRLRELQRAGEVGEMRRTISDAMVDAFCITCSWDELPGELLNRLGGFADEIVCYSVLEFWKHDPDSLERWQDVNRRYRELAAAAGPQSSSR